MEATSSGNLSATQAGIEPTAESSPVDEKLLSQVSGITEALPARPSWDAYFMATAMLLASRSSCERLHVGCVIVSTGRNRNRIVAAGYNGFLPGTPHRSRVRDGHEQATVHAEQNAIADAARRGVNLDGAKIYVTHFPCINCAKILTAAGIEEIIYRYNYRNDELVPDLLAESGVALRQL
ncbi:MAG: deoxycytidylate deaminase [Spirochaetales bacterium]